MESEVRGLNRVTRPNGHQLHYGVAGYTVITEPPFPPGWHMATHSHMQHEISLVLQGRCEIVLSGRERRVLNRHCAFVIPGGVSHGFEADDSRGVQLVTLQFPGADRAALESLVNSPPIGLVQLLDLEASLFMDLCHRMQREIAGKLPLATLQCEALLSELLVLMIRSASRRSLPYLTAEQRERIDRALAWIHEHQYDTVRIQEVARRVGLSAQHFRELFRRYVGVTPKRYLTALRLQTSKCLLMHANQSVTDVAMQAGFGNVQQFSKVFRKLVGLTPSEWRRISLLLPDPLGDASARAATSRHSPEAEPGLTAHLPYETLTNGELRSYAK